MDSEELWGAWEDIRQLISSFLEVHMDNYPDAGQPKYTEYLNRLHKLRVFLKDFN